MSIFVQTYYYVLIKMEFNINLLFVTYEGKGQKLKNNVQLTATLYDLLR